MKITAMATMVLMPCSLAHGESTALAVERRVTVCEEGMSTPRVANAGSMAQALASRMFADIGVTIEWRQGDRGCPAQAILVSLSFDTPESLKRGALAYARLFEGPHIRVFYDRINGMLDSSRVSIVLGHVLVHEITHILQGFPRHSATGVMKARWDSRDYGEMFLKPLRFEAEDIDLIHLGLARRATVLVHAPVTEAMVAGN